MSTLQGVAVGSLYDPDFYVVWVMKGSAKGNSHFRMLQQFELATEIFN